MAIYNTTTGLVQVRVRGVDSVIRDLARANDNEKRAVIRGIMKAAQYLMEKIKAKFGHYQSTGGSNGGAWAKLSYDTNARKLRRYGFMNKPLIGSGKMQESFSVKQGGEGTLAASVVSDDERLIHHIYGAPRANVPKRDPMLITAIEEADNCHKIIADETYRAYE